MILLNFLKHFLIENKSQSEVSINLKDVKSLIHTCLVIASYIYWYTSLYYSSQSSRKHSIDQFLLKAVLGSVVNSEIVKSFQAFVEFWKVDNKVDKVRNFTFIKVYFLVLLIFYIL